MADKEKEGTTIVNHDVYGVGRAATALAIAAALIGVFGFVTNNIQIGAPASAPPSITSSFNGHVSACPPVDNAAAADPCIQVVTVGNQKYACPAAKF